MASISFAPLRRNRTSSCPCLESKNHLPPFFTRGTGKGHSSFPTKSVARVLFLGSIATRFFSTAFSANAAARFLSRTASAEEKKSFPSGPKIPVKAATSYLAAAWIKASTACSGVLNTACPCGSVDWALTSGAEAPPSINATSRYANRCDLDRDLMVSGPPGRTSISDAHPHRRPDSSHLHHPCSMNRESCCFVRCCHCLSRRMRLSRAILRHPKCSDCRHGRRHRHHRNSCR